MSVLNRISLSKKLSILTIALFAPALFYGFQYVKSVGANAATAKHELQGAEYIRSMTALLGAVSQHRGASVALLSGDATFRERLVATEATAASAVAKVDTADTELAGGLDVRGQWSPLRAEWIALADRTATLPSAAASYAQHSALLAKRLDESNTAFEALVYQRLLGDAGPKPSPAEVFDAGDRTAGELLALIDTADSVLVTELQDRSDTLRFDQRTAIGIGVLIIAVAIGFSALITRSMTKPMARAISVFQSITAGDLNNPIGESGTDEAGQVLRALDTMQDRLKQVVASQQRLVEAANRGDFSERIDVQGLNGFQKQMGDELNRLLDTTGSSVEDMVRTMRAVSEGDLTQTIDKDYEGSFAQMKVGMEAVRSFLKSQGASIRIALDEIDRAPQFAPFAFIIDIHTAHG